MFDLSKYDNFEVHPVHAIGEHGHVVPISQFSSVPVALDLEQCDDDDVDIYSWGVYGHVPGEGIFYICDCPDKPTATFIQEGLLTLKDLNKNYIKLPSEAITGYRSA